MVPFAHDSRALEFARRVIVDGASFRVASARPVHGAWLVTLVGVQTPEAARALAGCVVEVPRSELPALEPGEFYATDLVGLTAVDPDGNTLGIISGVSNFGASDLLVIFGEQGERWVPLLEGVLHEVLLESGRVVVAPPEEG